MGRLGGRLRTAFAPRWELEGSEIRALLLDHFYRGARVQRRLRVLLLLFLAATLVWVPPAQNRVLCWVLLAGYAAWSAGIGLLVRSASVRAASYVWLALFVDVLATASLTLLTDASADVTWTSFVLVNGLYVIPVLAAAQLNPWASAVVSGAATIAFLVAVLETRHANGDEPLMVLALRTSVVATIGLGAVLLSLVQRRRVLAIGHLAEDRRHLIDELVDIGERERTELAEHLHDGALQYVLAARQDLEDVAEDAVARERVDRALGEAITLLRSTLTQLHPAVVHEAGLLAALQDLIAGAGRGTRLRVDLRARGWSDDTRTSADALLLQTARELLTNVVKHARATSLVVELALEPTTDGTRARMVLVDDGVGMQGVDLAGRLREGHLGLASRRIHVEAIGGSLTITPAEPHGTRVELVVPVNGVTQTSKSSQMR